MSESKRKSESVLVKPSDELKKKHKKTRPINYTICIPSTIISYANAKNLQQITQIAYEVAKSCTIYNVSEIVILNIDENLSFTENEESKIIKEGNKIKFNFDDDSDNNKEKKNSEISESSMILATLLQYFITPPYLIKSIFNKNKLKYLKYVKNYPTLTTLPFMMTNYLDSNENSGQFREGLSITEKTLKENKHIPGTKVKKSKERIQMTRYINVGLDKPLKLSLDEKIPCNVRVTVDLKNKIVVNPIEAYYSNQIGAKNSIGYLIRISKNFSSVFTESGFPKGYTNSVFVEAGKYFNNKETDPFNKTLPEIKNLDKTIKDNNLILFLGKKNDFQLSFKNDETLKEVENISEFFNNELKIPILTRIEDSILISLSKLETI